jgi:hypothetical protein
LTFVELWYAVAMSNSELPNALVQKWLAEDAELPEHLRPEEINKRWDDLSPAEREQTAMRQQIERRKNQAKREHARRPRAIGPVDRAIRTMSKY